MPYPSIFFSAWIVCLGRHTISRVWETTGHASSEDHSPAFRLFNQAVWNWDELCRILLLSLLTVLVPGTTLWLVTDDTLCHKRGAKVTGHLCAVNFREAADLGIDDLEHGLFVDTEFLPGKKPDECPDKPEDPIIMAKLDVNSGPLHDTIQYLVQHHVAVTSTLPVFEMGSFPGRPTVQQRQLDALSLDAKSAWLANRVRYSDAAFLKRNFGSEESPLPAAFKKELEFEYAFAKAGGLLLAGLDPTGMGGVIAGFGDQREVELLVEAGFTPLEAIHIASYNGAQYLGELDRIGTIAAGKQADLVVIKGDPSKKIEDIESVETVFKDGVGYDSAKLIEAAQGNVGTR